MARRVHVQKLPNGQYVLTVPKAEALGLRRGREVHWSLEGDRLVLNRLGKPGK
jgi:hypothetical protein